METNNPGNILLTSWSFLHPTKYFVGYINQIPSSFSLPEYSQTNIFLLFQCQAANGSLGQPPTVQDNCQASEGTSHGAFGSPNKNDNIPNTCECLLMTTDNLYLHLHSRLWDIPLNCGFRSG